MHIYLEVNLATRRNPLELSLIGGGGGTPGLYFFKWGNANRIWIFLLFFLSLLSAYDY